MRDKTAVSAYILEIVDPFLRLQMRAKEDFNRHKLFCPNKQYIKIKLMQVKGLNYHNFHIFDRN